MLKNTLKYTNHTKEEILEYLESVKISISKDKFRVCNTLSNRKNKNFLEEYKLTKNKQKEMLLELEVEDFCYSADDYNNQNERLYFFCREYELNNWGEIENVNVYIKMVRKQDDFVIVISFHKPEKDIKKLFV